MYMMTVPHFSLHRARLFQFEEIAKLNQMLLDPRYTGDPVKATRAGLSEKVYSTREETVDE
jgi:hypothetical protein